MQKLILASGSPRRREMLEKLGIPLKVVVSNCDETFPANSSITEGVRAVAKRKARGIEALDTDWVLGADTLVHVEGQVLGKPTDEAEARVMLESLSGRTHEVVTGVALVGPGVEESFAVSTLVSFAELSPEQIDWYVKSGEPMDKAGGYAVQGLAAAFVEAIEGSYTNVVGLPLTETIAALSKAGFAPWDIWKEAKR